MKRRIFVRADIDSQKRRPEEGNVEMNRGHAMDGWVGFSPAKLSSSYLGLVMRGVSPLPVAVVAVDDGIDL